MVLAPRLNNGKNRFNPDGIKDKIDSIGHRKAASSTGEAPHDGIFDRLRIRTHQALRGDYCVMWDTLGLMIVGAKRFHGVNRKGAPVPSSGATG